MADKSHARRSRPQLAEPIGGVRAPPEGVPAGAAALAKGLTLLDMVADAHEPLRFAQLLERSGLPKPTFARILRTVIAYGLIRQDDTQGTYSLGPRFLELSHRVWKTFDLETVAVPELERLSVELGETAALSCLDNDQGLYLDERSGAGLGVKVDTGRQVPLHCTAAGKALMAFQEPSYSRAIIKRISLDRFTEKTITTIDQLESDLTLTRARGYAVSGEEHLEGVNSVAVAIAGQDGTPIGALVALGPSTRLDESRMHVAGRELIAAARRITGSAGAVAISSHPRPRTRTEGGKPVSTVSCVLPWGAQLGECPVWSPTEQRLFWLDILHPAVYRFDPQSGKNESCELTKLVSAILLAEDDQLLVASQDGIEWLHFDEARFEAFVHPEDGIRENRLNDAKVGPGGSVWVGSMRLDASKPSGGLYRVTPNKVVERKATGITVANGLGWSPDNGTFYFVDTVPGLIYAYDCAPGVGTLTNRRVFAAVPETEGRPDGLAVDSDGGVWCAIWDGWRVNRYAPDGTLDRVIDLPVPRPTSVSFGDQDLKTLYVTTARTRLPASTLTEAPLSGGVFACSPGYTGLPTHYFRRTSCVTSDD